MDVRKKKLLIVLIGLLALLIAVGGFVLINTKVQQISYSEEIDTAEKCLFENDYETAIIHYEEAIEIDPENTEAYIGLADVYIQLGEFTIARAVLKQGYQNTASAKIEYLLNRLYSADVSSKQMAESGEVSLNVSFLQKLSTYTFEDYKEEFGSVQSVETDDEGYLRVVHSGVDGVFFYRNTADNREIVSISGGKPYDSGMPEKVQMDNISPLFRNYGGGITLETLQIISGERMRPEHLDDRYMLEMEKNNCVIRVETDSQGNIVSGEPWNEILLLNANQQQKSGQVTGVVIDAVTGDGVNDANVDFSPKGSSGSAESVVTNSGGDFSVTLEPGDYTVTVTADDYIEEEFDFEVEGGKSYSGEEFVISPGLASGTARIVLEWNAEPRDLDSYLVGESSSGADVDVNFMQREAKDGGDTVAELDLDDVDGFGPETTTIYDLNGTYTFHVKDFGNTGTMAQYGATVKIYMPGKSPKTVSLSAGSGVVDVWMVCKISHGQLTILNSAQ